MAIRAPRVSYRVGKHALTQQSAVLRKQSASSGAVANDAFFHSFFGRIALQDGSTVELTSRFNKQTGEIELDIPEKAIDALNGISKGDRLKEYLAWLTDGAAGNPGSGAGHMQTVTAIGPFATTDGGGNPQLLASLEFPTDTLDENTAVLFRVWGRFAANDKAKSAHLYLNGAQFGENDLTIYPNGLDWSFSGTIAIDPNGTSHPIITDGLVGNSPQNTRATFVPGVLGNDWLFTVFGHSDESPLAADDVICDAIMVRY